MSHTFTLTVDVREPKLLRRTAYGRAQDGAMSARDYARMRREHPNGEVACDLVMLSDPGSGPDGCSILDSHAEEDAL